MTEDSGRFVPLSVRERDGAQAWDVLQEGVPAHLAPSLRLAVARLLVNRSELVETVQRMLRLALPQRMRGETNVQVLLRFADEQPIRYLDVAECLLHSLRQQWLVNRGNYHPTHDLNDEAQQAINYVIELKRALDEAASTYTLHVEDDEPWRLVRRVDPTATAALHDAVQQGKHSSARLAGAWAATFQREANLALAYRDVVLAVESAACPVLIPNDTAPTLGKAIAHLGRTLERWSVAGLDDKSQKSAVTLHGMLQTVWQNQGRHAEQGGTAPAPVEQAEAEAVLFLAITLVQWFERGLVTQDT